MFEAREYLDAAIKAHAAELSVTVREVAIAAIEAALASSSTRTQAELEMAARAAYEATDPLVGTNWEDPWVSEPEEGGFTSLQDVYIKAARAVAESLGLRIEP